MGLYLSMVVLMIAVFTVSVGYGVVLARPPRLIERLLGAGVEATQVSRHTGLLTAVYTASLLSYSCPSSPRFLQRKSATNGMAL